MSHDVVVIGSGIGGLTAALALARTGKRVVVIEQHYLPGGWAHSFALDGHTFSPGVHYVGRLELGAGLRALFEGLGLGPHLAFRELPPDGYDHFLVGNERFDVPVGAERHLDRMQQRFPKSAPSIERYFETTSKLSSDIENAESFLGFPGVLALPFRAPALARWGFARLSSLFDDAGVRDPLARAFLAAQCGNHGLAPSEVSLPVHAAMIAHYRDGAYYPRGGAKRMPAAFIRELRKRGGAVRLSTRARRIVLEHGRAAGVELEDGEIVRADTVVSNADAATTYERLLPPRTCRVHRRWARRRRPSVSCVSLFAAVDMDLPALGYDAGNYWWYRDADVDGAYRRMKRALPDDELESVFVSVSTLKDPELLRNGTHTIEAFTFVPHAPFDQWKESETGHRVPSYDAHKARLTRMMLAAIERVIPGVSDHLVLAEVGTPLTNAFYCEARAGGCYGTEKSPFQVGPFSFSTRSAVPGLFLCGASTLSHGVAGAAISGLHAARDALDLPDAAELLDPPDGSLELVPNGAPEIGRLSSSAAR